MVEEETIKMEVNILSFSVFQRQSGMHLGSMSLSQIRPVLELGSDTALCLPEKIKITSTYLFNSHIPLAAT
jgi:hypothetical protein